MKLGLSVHMVVSRWQQMLTVIVSVPYVGDVLFCMGNLPKLPRHGVEDVFEQGVGDVLISRPGELLKVQNIGI